MSGMLKSGLAELYVNDSFPAPECDKATSKLVEESFLFVIA
jgi:hypothetical protein